MSPQDAYKKGFEDGLRAYAWWKSGTQYVGTFGVSLKRAVEGMEMLQTFDPPKDDPNSPANLYDPTHDCQDHCIMCQGFQTRLDKKGGGDVRQ